MPFKIRRKLTLAFVGIILFIISVVGIIAYYNQQAFFSSLHRVEYAYTEREYFSDIRIAVENTVMAANDYLISGDRKEREAFDRSASEAERLFREIPYEKVCKRCHPVLKGMVDRFYAIKGKEMVEEMKSIKELSDSYAKIRSKGEEIFALEKPVGSVAGTKLMEEMDALYRTETGRIIMGYRETIRARVFDAIAAAHAVRGRSWLIMLLAAVILPSIGLIFSRLYARSFVLPIESMHERADTIARGDFKARVDVKSRDEIGQLANAMNEMAAQLEGFYSTLEAQVRERTRGLQESEERFRQLFQGGNDAIFVHHILPDGGPGKFIEVNNLACERLGFTREEFLNMSPLDIDAPDMSGSREAILKDFAEKKHAIFEMAHMTKDGRRIPVEVNAHIFELSGEPMVLSIVRDITERKKAEETIKKERDYSKSIIETAQAIILTLDTEGRIVSFNRYMEELSGYKLDEVKGKDWFTTFISEYEQGRIRSLFKEAISDIQIKGNVNSILTRDGREVVVEWYAETLKDSNGNILGLLSIGHDITERKEAEEKLKKNLDDLKRMNKMMVDREIRMIELKKENQRLRDEAGKKSS